MFQVKSCQEITATVYYVAQDPKGRSSCSLDPIHVYSITLTAFGSFANGSGISLADVSDLTLIHSSGFLTGCQLHNT